MSASVSRLTIYALIAAMESDLRRIIHENCGSIGHTKIDTFKETIEKAKIRWINDNNERLSEEISLSELCTYFDFSDSYLFIRHFDKLFPDAINSHIKTNIKTFEKLAPIRNKVMHIRPLNFEDLPFTIDECTRLANEDKLIWQSVNATLQKISSDEGYVLRLEIPSDLNSNKRINHNLPLPDFDETGLIGRTEIIKEIKKLCKGPYPVISIVGEGGVGKSAVALKVAYEILDDDSYDFDAVMWVTSKTTQISPTEIIEIRGAIKTSLGLFSELSQFIAGTVDNPIDEILDYLETFKVLLFIDNLETILDAQVRSFFGALPIGSKIIITSRIGLGAFEYPLKLHGLDEPSSCRLARQLAKIRHISTLSCIQEKTLANYCKRLHYNPGYIKWFVATTGTGVQPEHVLQNSGIFLDFCMSNIYTFLSDNTKNIISIFLLVPGWKDLAELAYFSESEPADVQKSIQELLSTNMLTEQSKQHQYSIKTLYRLAELPRAFLTKQHKVDSKKIERITKLKNNLRSIQNYYDESFDNSSKYDPKNIKIRDKSDRLVAKKLSDAHKLIRNHDFESAFKVFSDAKQLAPDYYEVHRGLAHYYSVTRDFVEAKDAYNLAISLNPNSPELLYWFGNFLLNKEDDIESAIGCFEKAHKLDNLSIDIKFSLIRCNLYLNRFDEAEQLLDEISKYLVYEQHSTVQNKIYHDLALQFHVRRADFEVQSYRYAKALGSIINAKNHYEKIPEDCKDERTMNRLLKIQRYITAVEKSDCCRSYEYEINEVQNWLNKRLD